LYEECWIDIEPHTGAVVGATQKLLISALIEKDDLFEIDDKFIPVYFLYRSGNFTEESVMKVFGDLLIGFAFRQIILLFGSLLIFLWVSVMIFSCIKIRVTQPLRDSMVVPLTDEEVQNNNSNSQI
jgi:Ca2+-dependent lipid-binding protein